MAHYRHIIHHTPPSYSVSTQGSLSVQCSIQPVRRTTGTLWIESSGCHIGGPVECSGIDNSSEHALCLSLLMN